MLYGSFGFAMIPSDMDTNGNCTVEEVYDLSSLTYNYNSQQLPFSVSTMIKMTPDNTRKTSLCDVAAPLPDIFARLYNSVRKYKAWHIYTPTREPTTQTMIH
jgi:uncharacterized protein YcbK (DUF882 family)